MPCPGIDDGNTEILEVANVARGEGRAPRRDNSRDFDVPKVDGLPSDSARSGTAGRCLGRVLVEGQDPSLEVLGEGAAERSFQPAPAAA
jgi:hypothetical protein